MPKYMLLILDPPTPSEADAAAAGSGLAERSADECLRAAACER